MPVLQLAMKLFAWKLQVQEPPVLRARCRADKVLVKENMVNSLDDEERPNDRRRTRRRMVEMLILVRLDLLMMVVEEEKFEILNSIKWNKRKVQSY